MGGGMMGGMGGMGGMGMGGMGMGGGMGGFFDVDDPLTLGAAKQPAPRDTAAPAAETRKPREIQLEASAGQSTADAWEAYFNRPLQEMVTEYCWGAVWGREELPKKTRSMLNLAMLSALNRPHELKLHVRGAINNGVTKVEIREVLLQAAIYCGVPAAIDSFRTAREVFKEDGV